MIKGTIIFTILVRITREFSSQPFSAGKDKFPAADVSILPLDKLNKF
jgi:hypothetical protein